MSDAVRSRSRTAPTLNLPRLARRHLFELVSDMEVPLNEASDFIEAIHVIGYGMIELGNEDRGRSIIAVATAVSQRLDSAKSAWRLTIHALQG